MLFTCLFKSNPYERPHTLHQFGSPPQPQSEKKLVPSSLMNRKRIEELNTLGEDVETSSDGSEKADGLSIRVNDEQFSDIIPVAGDDIDQISPIVEEYTVSTESRQGIEEMEVAVASTSFNNHTVIFAGDAKEKTTTCSEVSSIRTEKLNAIKRNQDRLFNLGA